MARLAALLAYFRGLVHGVLKMDSHLDTVGAKTMFASSKLAIVLFATLLEVTASASSLDPRTLAAWQTYTQKVEAPSQHFLWIDDDAKRAEKLRSGYVEIHPLLPSGFERVPEGLIHHWFGAIFVPNSTLDQVLALLADYDRYKQIYGSDVDAKYLSHLNDEDEFSMKIVSKVLFVSTGVNMLCRSQTTRLDDRRALSRSRTIRVNEIQDYGRPNERELAPDTGDGYIWRLYSLTRLEERDGGVYIETQRLALTRDIPGSLHFLLAPVIRRLSQNSMAASLQKTRQASQWLAASLRPNPVSVSASDASKRDRPRTTALNFTR